MKFIAPAGLLRITFPNPVSTGLAEKYGVSSNYTALAITLLDKTKIKIIEINIINNFFIF